MHPALHLMHSHSGRSVGVALTQPEVSVYLPCCLPTVHETAPPSLPRVPRTVPLDHRYYEALRTPDSRFAALRFLRLAIPWSVCVSSPFGRRRLADGSSRSLLYRLLLSRSSSGNCQDLPRSRGTLVIIRRALRPRRDQAAHLDQGQDCLTRPPHLTTTRAHNEEISGLNHTAFDLAVYASQWRFPATTQDSLLAVGPTLPGGIGYPQGSNERFHIRSPFPEHRGAMSSFVFCFRG